MRSATTIAYAVGVPGRVRIQIFDVAGRTVRTLADADESAGHRSVVWDGSGDDGTPVGRGIYAC
jgi:flagellar hook assembly protein FlgD